MDGRWDLSHLPSFSWSLPSSKHKNFENNNGGNNMVLISIKALMSSPMDIDIRNVKIQNGHKIMCHIQDEYGLNIDTQVIEQDNEYYVNI